MKAEIIADLKKQIEKLKMEVDHRDQVIFSMKHDAEMAKWQNAQGDIYFLKEIKDKINDGREKHDSTSFDYAFKMIDDWIDEIKGYQDKLEIPK